MPSKEHELGAEFLADDTNLPGTSREDVSNAHRFSKQHSKSVRFWHGRKVWLVWSGMHWEEDDRGLVVELAKQTARSIYYEAASLPEAEAKEMAKWASRTMMREKINAMMSLSESDPRIAITTEELDANPWLLNFKNGTVYLRTGKYSEHRREDYITKLIDCDYHEELIGPQWMLFIEQTFSALASWVQKAVGYSFTGITSEKVVFLLLGPTDTGKTTFLTTLKTIFADYSSMMQIDTLMWSKNEDNNTSADLADLRGARFVVTSETEEGQRLREGKLKRITQGMGEIRSARKYENPITFPETHKLWIDANYAPAIRGVDDAIWKRLLPIPCRHKPEKRDLELANKLLQESEAIASWLVAGALRWQREGLERPGSIEETRDSWKSNMDLLGEFITDCCVEGEGESCAASELYSTFQDWSKKQGYQHPMTQTAFGTRLADRGFGKKLDARSRRKIYDGLRLRLIGDC
jgi:putative DNA primase/helicase